MDAPSPKRARQAPLATSSIEKSGSFPTAPGFNQSDVDLTISSFLSLSDLPLFSSPLSIGCSFDRVLDKFTPLAAETSGDKFDQDRFLDRTLQLASLLSNSTKRCIRKRATLQNSISWPLLPELTVKVFSMLDTKSLMQASASCTFFNKCAMDRVCYSHIDLTMTAKNIDNGVVCIMIHRAGKELRSLKVGSANPTSRYTSLLTRSCLSPLSFNHGYAGGLLKSLHLYNLTFLDNKFLCTLLSTCSNLTDLKIAGLASDVEMDHLEQLASLTGNCHLLENLYIDFHGAADLETDLSHSALSTFLDNCPNLTSLSLLYFGINDAAAYKLIAGFRQLKYLNLSHSYDTDGSFFRGLLIHCKDSQLETIILRNCYALPMKEVLHFLESLLAGDLKSLRLFDVSYADLISDEGKRTLEPKFPVEELTKQRPDLTFVAVFGEELFSSSSGELLSDYTSSESSVYISEEEEEHDDELGLWD